MRRRAYEAFCRAYEHVPDRPLNALAGRLSRAKLPRPVVRALVEAWSRREGIVLSDFEDAPHASIHEFFVRRLRTGARPIGAGIVSPVDGEIIFDAPWKETSQLSLKGAAMRPREVFGRGVEALGEDARVVSIFLSPRGYHRVHAPSDLRVREVRHVPGRFFPQNRRALVHIPAVYERNERVTLVCETEHGPLFLCMIGACMVGSVAVDDELVLASRRVDLDRAKGEELGFFAFGSTVVLATRTEGPLLARVGEEVAMGRTLFAG